jgi:hypothetical protein
MIPHIRSATASGQFPPPSFVAGTEELASIPDTQRGQLAACVRLSLGGRAASPWRRVLPSKRAAGRWFSEDDTPGERRGQRSTVLMRVRDERLRGRHGLAE